MSAPLIAPGAVLTFALCALVFVAAVVGTAAVRRWALRRHWIDHPNARSSHETPTPRGGGVAIAAAALGGLGLAAVAGLVSPRLALALGPATALVAVVGWIDDRGGVAVRPRLALHALAALWACAWLGPVASLGAGALASPLPAVLAWPLSVLAIVWVLNLYNFMDGIDGIAALEAAFFGVAGALLMREQPQIAAAALLIGAACAGFVRLNWPPARIFMGDVGSGFVGCWIGVLVIAASSASLAGPWPWAIVLGVFVVDATLTLVRRAARGARLTDAHRSHAYQRAARRFGGHRPVTIAVLVIDVVWLLPLALYAQGRPALAPLLLAVAWAPLVALALWLGAGLPDEPASPSAPD